MDGRWRDEKAIWRRKKERNKDRNVKEAKQFIKANRIRRQSLVVAGLSGMADQVSRQSSS